MDNKKNKQVTRRRFIRDSAITAAGLGSVLAGCKAKQEKEPNAVEPEVSKTPEKEEYPRMPRRKMGKTGVKVSCLALGTITNLIDKQIVLQTALRWGVDYWDTARGYANGNSELGIGKFLSKNPQVRKRLFLVTKASGAKIAEDVERYLQASLKRMNTKYIDLFYGVHVLNNISQLKDKLKPWAESAKKRGLIKYFGFSTHSNMAQNLAAAAKLDWIDGILVRYNFRLRHDAKMQAAIEACHKAGIALTAMKTQALPMKTEEDRKLAEHFLQRGFTEGQAKIKAVLEDRRFSSACVGMYNVGVLTENVAAVLDKTRLTQADRNVFKEYARATCDGYCAGCAYICDSSLPNVPYVSDIMRYLMYYNSYGDKERARGLFAQIPAGARNRLLSTDYRLAESRCPQHLPIAELVAEAVSKLA